MVSTIVEVLIAVQQFVRAKKAVPFRMLESQIISSAALSYFTQRANASGQELTNSKQLVTMLVDYLAVNGEKATLIASRFSMLPHALRADKESIMMTAKLHLENIRVQLNGARVESVTERTNGVHASVTLANAITKTFPISIAAQLRTMLEMNSGGLRSDVTFESMVTAITSIYDTTFAEAEGDCGRMGNLGLIFAAGAVEFAWKAAGQPPANGRGGGVGGGGGGARVWNSWPRGRPRPQGVTPPAAAPATPPQPPVAGVAPFTPRPAGFAPWAPRQVTPFTPPRPAFTPRPASAGFVPRGTPRGV